MSAKLECLICGGQHVPHPKVCDVAGQLRQQEKIGVRLWNRLARPLMTPEMREWIDQQSGRK